MTEALIIDACRTPRGIGKVGKGALADIHPQQLAASTLKALAERNELNTAEVDDVIWGTSSQRGKQGGDLGRMAALDAGYDVSASGMTLDRFCGSGITAVNLAAASIMSGMEDLVDRRRHGDDVLHRVERRPEIGRRSWTAATCACARAIRSRTRASAPTPSPRWKASRARRSTSWRSSASSAPTPPSRAGHFDKSLVAGLQRRRHARARPRGIPAPADHAWKALPALKPSFEAMADVPLDEQGHDLRRADPPGLSGPEDQAHPPRRQFLGRGRRRGGGAAGLAGLCRRSTA